MMKSPDGVPDSNECSQGCGEHGFRNEISEIRGSSSINGALNVVLPTDLPIRPRLMKLGARLLEKQSSKSPHRHSVSKGKLAPDLRLKSAAALKNELEHR